MDKDERREESVSFTDNEQINQLLAKLVKDVKAFAENQLGRIRRLAGIGVALSAEKELDRLLELIMEEARSFTGADGGTLYIMSDDETELLFAIVHNGTLNIRMGGRNGTITWPPVPLKNPDGTPNHANVSAYAALSGEVVNIPDVYDAEGFNFEGTRKFDAGTGYRSKSMLVVPLRNHENDIIGVLQLLNARDQTTGAVIPFSEESQKMTEALASQAAVALTNKRLIQGLEELLESFIKSIATAIDEKSPYTGGHVRRVAELTMAIAGRINEAREGPFAPIRFSDEEMKELRIAAWLHDVGKITTPEHIVDKATKLETVYDRIDALKTRFEVLKRDRQIAAMMRGGGGCDTGGPKTPDLTDEALMSIESDLDFLMSVNAGGEFMADGMIERLREIAGRRWMKEGEWHPLLTDDEVYNLSIRRGTLTDEEREIINNHAVMTYRMLSQLPFPKKLSRVPTYAATHHERPDGTGYPLGLKDAELPIQSRILALADIFEALTAGDRPYKKGKTLSEALKIMAFMAKDRHIDKDLFDFFINKGIHLDYARRELRPHQVDIEEQSK